MTSTTSSRLKMKLSMSLISTTLSPQWGTSWWWFLKWTTTWIVFRKPIWTRRLPMARMTASGLTTWTSRTNCSIRWSMARLSLSVCLPIIPSKILSQSSRSLNHFQTFWVTIKSETWTSFSKGLFLMNSKAVQWSKTNQIKLFKVWRSKQARHKQTNKLMTLPRVKN